MAKLFSTIGVFAMILVSMILFRPAHAEKMNPVKVGGTVSMEGKYRETSLMIQGSYKLWEQQVNSRGGLLGRPVKLILYDDKSRKDLVRTHYETLVREDRVDLVLSPYGTPLTLIASEVTESHGKIMLACAASGEKIWERGHRFVFGVYALAKRYFIGILDLLARNGLDDIGLLYENTVFNRDVAEGARKWANRFGLKTVADLEFNDGKSEMPGLLTKVRAVDPDALLLSAYPPDGYRLLHVMRKAAYRPRVVGMTIAPVHPDFYKRAGGDGEGVFGPSQWEADERIPFPGTKQFIKDFRNFTRKIPSYHGGSAYAACQILERAVRHNGSLDQEKIRDFVKSLDTVTVIGRFKVDTKGKQVGHNPITIQWQKGKKEIVYPTKMQTAVPIL
jgi:branched-chain amino acid transport system substrate-binding protein